MSRTSAYPRRQAVQSRPFAVLMVLLLVLLAGPALTADPASAAPADGAGYVDFTYAAVPGADDLTAHHSQNKLWFHDGRWWAVMLDPLQERWEIFWLDGAKQAWTSTDVTVDKRNTSHADVLSDGNTLYVVSAYSKTATGPVGFFAYSYDAVGKKYVRKTGFAPAGSASGGFDTAAVGVSYATVAKDSAGTLWVAYTASDQVRYMTSTAASGGLTWSAPAAIPVGAHAPIAGAPGATPSSDDVASVVSFGGGRIGVLWSSSDLSSNGGFFFAVRGASGWGPVETAWGGVNVGDNHISVKAASDGRVIAVVKSSKEKDPNAGAQPLIAALERTTAGTWSPNIRNVSKVSEARTRPILVLDEGAGQANVFMTSEVNGGHILRRTAPLSSLTFGASPTVFIKSSAHPNINDPSSTKQPASAASGIVVLAADYKRADPTVDAGTYLHGCAGAACTGAVTPAPTDPHDRFGAASSSATAAEIVSRASTGVIVHRTWSKTAGLGPVASMGGKTASAPAVTRSSSGSLDAFVTGTNGQLYLNRRTSPSADWSGWTSLGGGLSGRIAAVALADGTVSAFVRGNDGAIWQRSRGASGSWSGWTRLGGGTPAGTGPAAVATTDGGIQVVVHGNDNRAWLRAWRPTSGWSAWRSLGGRLRGDPSIASDAPGKTTLAVRGTDNAVWALDVTGATPGQWKSLGGAVPVSPVATALPASGQLHVLVNGMNGSLYGRSRVSGVWGAWALAG